VSQASASSLSLPPLERYIWLGKARFKLVVELLPESVDFDSDYFSVEGRSESDSVFGVVGGTE